MEHDETYVGGKAHGKRGLDAENKTPVFGAVQRKGKLKAIADPDTKSKTVLPIVDKTVERGTQVYTDEYLVYNRLTRMGYNHSRVLHSHNNYAIGNVHTNTIEGFWSLCKVAFAVYFTQSTPNICKPI